MAYDMLFSEVKTMSKLTSGECSNREHDASQWVKSSLSYANGDCVEVASLPDGRVGVRDSKDSAGPVLRFTSAEWKAFVGGVQNGEFDCFSS
jgi:hypothetical protein